MLSWLLLHPCSDALVCHDADVRFPGRRRVRVTIRLDRVTVHLKTFVAVHASLDEVQAAAAASVEERHPIPSVALAAETSSRRPRVQGAELENSFDRLSAAPQSWPRAAGWQCRALVM